MPGYAYVAGLGSHAVLQSDRMPRRCFVFFKQKVSDGGCLGAYTSGSISKTAPRSIVLKLNYLLGTQSA